MKQGPAWEAQIVKDLERHGPMDARRIDKSSDSKAPSDIAVGDPIRSDPVFLAWKRYKGTKSEGRRSTHSVVVMDYEVWLSLIWMARWQYFWVEAKASQSESVTTVLAKATKKVRDYEAP